RRAPPSAGTSRDRCARGPTAATCRDRRRPAPAQGGTRGHRDWPRIRRHGSCVAVGAMAHRAPRFEPLGAGPFAKAHADFTEVEAFDWASLGASVSDAKERERGRRSFVLRALDEQRSLVAFA